MHLFSAFALQKSLDKQGRFQGFLVVLCVHKHGGHMWICNNTHPHSLPVPNSDIHITKNAYSQSLLLFHNESEQQIPDSFLQGTVELTFMKEKEMMDTFQGMYLPLTPNLSCLVFLLHFYNVLMTYLNSGTT